MKVVLDGGNAPPMTGIGVYSRNLLRVLSEYNSDQFQVEESRASAGSGWPKVLRRTIYLAKMNFLRRTGVERSDITHFTNVYVPKPLKRERLVGTIHDLDAILFPETYPRMYRAYFRRIVNQSLNNAHSILTISEASRRAILDFGGIPPDRVVTIGQGLSREFTDAADEEESHANHMGRSLLFVGSLCRKKNVAWLIRTLKTGRDSGVIPPIQLVLAGGAGFGFEEIADALQVAGSFVRWVRNPSTQEIVRLYRQAMAVVLPSITEGFGIPLLEAMYCRKPIIASKIQSSMEVAQGAAMFFETGNEEEFLECVRLVSKGDYDETFLEMSRQNVQRFHWNVLGPKYLEFYRRCILS